MLARPRLTSRATASAWVSNDGMQGGGRPRPVPAKPGKVGSGKVKQQHLSRRDTDDPDLFSRFKRRRIACGHKLPVDRNLALGHMQPCVACCRRLGAFARIEQPRIQVDVLIHADGIVQTLR